MASITPINTATDTPSSAAVRTNANELAINTELEANTIATGLNTAKTGITTDQANEIIANNAKVTNATHTGDVTGSGALTISSTAISGKPTLTLDGTEEVLLNDDGTVKKTTTQDIADLGGGGGVEMASFESPSNTQSTISKPGTVDITVTQFNNIAGLTLSSNVITFPSGTYYIDFFTVFYDIGTGVIQLFDVTNSVILKSSNGSQSDSTDPSSSPANIKTILTFATSTDIRFDFDCIGGNSKGLGGTQFTNAQYIAGKAVQLAITKIA